MGAPKTGMPDPVLMGGWMKGDGGGDGRCTDASPSIRDDDFDEDKSGAGSDGIW